MKPGSGTGHLVSKLVSQFQNCVNGKIASSPFLVQFQHLVPHFGTVPIWEHGCSSSGTGRPVPELEWCQNGFQHIYLKVPNIKIKFGTKKSSKNLISPNQRFSAKKYCCPSIHNIVPNHTWRTQSSCHQQP